MKYILLTVSLVLSACQSLPGLPAPGFSVAAVSPTRVWPGQSGTATLTLVRTGGHSAPVTMTAQSPLPGLDAVVTTSGTLITVQLSAAADLPPQGLVPVELVLSDGVKEQKVWVPVEIGDVIDREQRRLNDVRALAGLRAVSFQPLGSMNCWLHSRYATLNQTRGHTEDLTLPYATPGGLACAEQSNVMSFAPTVAELQAKTTVVDVLITAPFHAVGMLDKGLGSSAIGQYVRTQPLSGGYHPAGAAITVSDRALVKEKNVTFPGAGTRTDLLQYAGGEWPDPLTPCAGFSAAAGLPLIVTTTADTDTTVSQASVRVGGVPVEVCAYGSAQYVNTTDAPGNYTSGPAAAQDVGRRILKGSGAVFVIPREPLAPDATVDAEVTINGERHAWSFTTAPAGSLRPHQVRPQVRVE